MLKSHARINILFYKEADSSAGSPNLPVQVHQIYQWRFTKFTGDFFQRFFSFSNQINFSEVEQIKVQLIFSLELIYPPNSFKVFRILMIRYKLESSSHPGMFYKNRVFKNFVKFKGKRLRWSHKLHIGGLFKKWLIQLNNTL